MDYLHLPTSGSESGKIKMLTMEQVRRKFDRILPWDLGADSGSDSIFVDQFPKCLDLDNLGIK
jgi:hypothetical protein